MPSNSLPQMCALGKQLYEVKYQCQSCHTIGSDRWLRRPESEQCRELAHAGVDRGLAPQSASARAGYH